MLHSLTQSSRPVFSFPELKSSEIIQFLGELNIKLSEADLIKPTSNTAIRVYETFMFVFIGSVQYSPKFESFKQNDDQYPELFCDALEMISFYHNSYRSLFFSDKLMKAAGIDDYSLRDLMRPDNNRFKIILSALINFARFREEQLPLFDAFARKTEELNIKNTQLLRQKMELTMKISAIEYIINFLGKKEVVKSHLSMSSKRKLVM